ncbi:amidohydrolase [uncultured Fusobacterium sp.]|uniref:amidohydrolase n=1 Tax=uncultured Fusobacterium sp. TaxID=159267 RepID=UPI0025FE623F|nr:amidohydrolase [uncultured Fusobacterium sp.]
MTLDTLLYNGEFHSMDEANSIYEAIGIKDGKISFLGKDKESENLKAKEKIDMKGKLVFPGFVDTHLHALDYAETKKFVKLNGSESVEEVIKRGKEHYKKNGLSQGWLIGWGWNQSEFKDGNDFIYKKDLDKISTDYPIILSRVCAHVAVVNSKAIEMIMKNKISEEAMEYIDIEKGTLRESSITVYRKTLEKPTIEYIKEMILLAQEDFLKEGITQVHSADYFSAVPEEDWEKVITAYTELEKEGKLKVRTYEQNMFFVYENFEEFINKGYRTRQGGEYFKIGPLKVISDGSLGARTAYMNEPYTDDSSTCGIQILDEDQLRKFFRKAKENNMQVAVHGIGDGAIEIAADILNEVNKDDLSNPMRNGIVHAQITNKRILNKMVKGNITAYIQPVFIDTDMEIAEERLGKERTDSSYAWKTMLDEGLHISGGSDAPVVSFNILENIYFAVTSKNIKGLPEGGWMPSQRLSIDEAVRLFTINAAYQSFEENIKGTLEIGKYADITGLEKNIYNIPKDEIKDVKISFTMVNGEIVYKKD